MHGGVLNRPRGLCHGGVMTQAYIHTQSSPAATWTITHNLDGVPTSDVVVGGLKVIPAGVQHLDNNTLVITFTSAQQGTARLVTT
jgi:hypothetical protein